MRKTSIIFGVLLLAAAVILTAGCTGTSGSQTPVQTAVPAVTETPSATVPTEVPTEVPWTLWKEKGTKTLNALGGYFVYSPNSEGTQYYNELRMVITSGVPVTVLYLTDDNLVKFKNKLATNSGTYDVVMEYPDVKAADTYAKADEALNIVIWNKDTQVATPEIEIYYK